MEQSPQEVPRPLSEHEESLRAAQERLKPLYERLAVPTKPSVLSLVIQTYLKTAHERDKKSLDTEE